MTDRDDQSMPGNGADADPHAAYRQQAAAHFGDTQNDNARSDGSQSAGQQPGRGTPRLFRPTDDVTPSTTANATTPPPPAPATPSGRGLPPASGQRFGAGTTYTGRGPDQPAAPSQPAYVAPPSPPPYVPPTNPPSAPPLPDPTPVNPTNWQTPSSYPAPQPPVNAPQPLSLPLSDILRRFNDAVDRLLLRGTNGELLRQPWFDSMRYQNADLFVYLSYGAAAVISMILGAGIGSTAVMILLFGLWAGLAYLYVALNTRLARQFLEYGICLVAVVVSVGTALAALGTLFGDGFGHGYPTAVAEGLLGLFFSLAAGLFFGGVGLRVHQAVPVPPPAAGPGATPQSFPPFTTPAGPNPANTPPSPPGQPNWSGGAHGSSWPPPTGPQVPYPALTGGGGTAVAAAVLSFIGTLWFGIVAKDAAKVLAAVGQMMDSLSHLGLKVGWPFYAAIGLSVVQIAIPILLLIGGIQLLSRRLAGRRTVAWGCALLLALSAFYFLTFVGAAEWLSTWTAGIGYRAGFGVSSVFAEAGLRWVAAPAVFAVVTMICALSPSTRQWCRPLGGAYGAPWYGPPAGP